MKLNEQVMGVIQANLPEMVVGNFKKYVDELEQTAKKYKFALEEVAELKKSNESLYKTDLEIREMAGKRKKLDADLEDLKKQQEMFYKETLGKDKEIAEIKRKEAEKRSDSLMELMKVICKNETIHSFHANIPFAPTIDQYGNPQPTQDGYINGHVNKKNK
jgi:chromosome segregation ATPase